MTDNLQMTCTWQTNDKQMTDTWQTHDWQLTNDIQMTDKWQTHDRQMTHDRQLTYTWQTNDRHMTDKWQTEKEHWEGACSWEQHSCMISLHQEYLQWTSIHISWKEHIPESVHTILRRILFERIPERSCMISLHQEYLLRRSNHIVYWEGACSWEGAHYIWEGPYCTQETMLYICCSWKGAYYYTCTPEKEHTIIEKDHIIYCISWEGAHSCMISLYLLGRSIHTATCIV